MPSAAVAGVDELLHISAHRRHSSVLFMSARRTLNEHRECWPAALHCAFAHFPAVAHTLLDVSSRIFFFFFFFSHPSAIRR